VRIIGPRSIPNSARRCGTPAARALCSALSHNELGQRRFAPSMQKCVVLDNHEHFARPAQKRRAKCQRSPHERVSSLRIARRCHELLARSTFRARDAEVHPAVSNGGFWPFDNLAVGRLVRIHLHCRLRATQRAGNHNRLTHRKSLSKAFSHPKTSEKYTPRNGYGKGGILACSP
jgi:hypothetical protein